MRAAPMPTGTLMPGDAGTHRPLSRKALSIFEAVLVYGLVEAALWSEMRWRIGWSLAVLAVVIAIGIRRRDLWPRLGVGSRNFRDALPIVLAGIAGSVLMLVPARFAGTVHMLYGPHLWAIAAGGYLLWAVQQQYLLQSFFLTRFEDLLGSRRKAVIAAAVTFSFAHLPNPILMVATLAMGLVFCSWFVRHRNIYPLAVAHAVRACRSRCCTACASGSATCTTSRAEAASSRVAR